MISLKKQPKTGFRASTTSSKKSIKQVDKSLRCTLNSLNTAKNPPFLQHKYPKIKMYERGMGLLGREANSAINTVVYPLYGNAPYFKRCFEDGNI